MRLHGVFSHIQTMKGFDMKYRGVECVLLQGDKVSLSYNGVPVVDKDGVRLLVDAPFLVKGYIDCLIAIGYV